MNEDNLALRPNVTIAVSVSQPSGAGARDPHSLLNERARLHGQSLADFIATPTYDTYDGQNVADTPDWYAIEFAEPTTFNCVEMTMGLPTGGGGWWTTLHIETCTAPGVWRRVDNLHIFQPYNFEDRRGDRRPFEPYTLTFKEVTAQAVRVIGRPGGPAQYTSLARLAVYRRDLSRWNPADVPPSPIPRPFQLVAPETIWDLCEHLATLSGMLVNFSFLEYYLDADRYAQYWRRIATNYDGAPELWFLVAQRLGWDAWRHILGTLLAEIDSHASDPQVQTIFHATLAMVIAPVVVDDQTLGQVMTEPVVLHDELDWDTQQRLAQTYGLPWPTYQAALERSPHMTQAQLASAAAMMQLIATAIAQLAQRNLTLENRLDGANRSVEPRSQSRQTMVRQAVDLMEKNLETPIGVADVARMLGLSLPYFSTLFTALTGRNPRDFLIDLRIERAKEYLSHRSLSVREVCAMLGYSRSYFSRVFKQRTGQSPDGFARHMRHNGANGLRPPHFYK